MAIVDIYGTPITSAPKELQTDEARVSGILHHFAEHPSRGLTPSKLAGIMVDAERGTLITQCQLAEDIEEKDGHIYAELQKRRRALLGLGWQITPPRNASKAEQADVAMLTELLEDRNDHENLVFNLSDAILKGFSCLELEWQTIERMRVPLCHWRDQSWFQTHPDHPEQLRLRSATHEGDALQPFGWLKHIHAAKSGYVGRTALARVLAWPFLFKNYSVRDLAEFLEIYGLPLRLGKYPTGASEKEKATLLRAVMSIGHNAGGIVPRGMDIDFQEAAKGGSVPFEAMISWCEKTQSKAILGGTLTSQADGKSSTNALGNVHNEVRQELRDSDANQIAATITRDLIYPLYAFNGRSFSGPHRVPQFEFDLSEPEDIAHYAQHLPALVDLGMRIPVSWVTDKLQIPEPEGDEPVLAHGAQTTPDTEPTALAALKAESKGHEDQDAIEAALDHLSAGDLSAQMLEMLQPLFTAANDTPEELQGMLAELWPQMNDDQLMQKLTQVLFVGELWGQIHADA